MKVLGLFARYHNLDMYKNNIVVPFHSRAEVFGGGIHRPIFFKGEMICPINGDYFNVYQIQAKFFTRADGSVIPFFNPDGTQHFDQDHAFIFALDDTLAQPYVDGSTKRGIAFCAQKTSDRVRANVFPFIYDFKDPHRQETILIQTHSI